MEEQGLDPRTGGPLDLASRQAKFANLAAMKHPTIHAALHRMFDNDLDDRFEAGLDLLISGLKARIDTRSLFASRGPANCPSRLARTRRRR
jgi:TetR/AcrR family tetracycline transcriptional repressor